MLRNQTVLKRTEENEIFQLLQENGFNPSDFSWVEESDNDYRISVLVHKPTDYYLQFKRDLTNTIITYSPDHHALDMRVIVEKWDSAREYVSAWVTALKSEVEAPNLWNSVGTLQGFQEVVSDQENTSFSDSETDAVASALIEIREYCITACDAQEEQKSFITKRFDYLESAIKRQSKVDWLHTFMGVFVTIFTAMNMTPEQMQEFWNFASRAIGSAVGIFQKLIRYM